MRYRWNNVWEDVASAYIFCQQSDRKITVTNNRKMLNISSDKLPVPIIGLSLLQKFLYTQSAQNDRFIAIGMIQTCVLHWCELAGFLEWCKTCKYLHICNLSGCRPGYYSLRLSCVRTDHSTESWLCFTIIIFCPKGIQPKDWTNMK